MPQRRHLTPQQLETCFDDYVDAIVKYRTTANGLCSIKAHYHQLAGLFAFDRMKSILKDAKFIWIKRQDILKQAVSHAKAVKTGAWTSWYQSQNTVDESHYDKVLIDSCLTRIMENNLGWEKFFAVHRGSPLYTVYYEDLCADPAAQVHNIVRFIGIDPPPDYCPPQNPDNLEKQSDTVNDIWLARYLEESRLF